MTFNSKYSSIAEYVLSDEFDKKVRRVSVDSRPFGNSSTSAEIYAALEKFAKEDEKKSNVSNT